MEYPLSTGQCARLLNISERTLSEAVRRGIIQSEIPILAGRRLWSAAAVREAAHHLGVSLANLAEELHDCDARPTDGVPEGEGGAW